MTRKLAPAQRVTSTETASHLIELFYCPEPNWYMITATSTQTGATDLTERGPELRDEQSARARFAELATILNTTPGEDE